MSKYEEAKHMISEHKKNEKAYLYEQEWAEAYVEAYGDGIEKERKRIWKTLHPHLNRYLPKIYGILEECEKIIFDNEEE